MDKRKCSMESMGGLMQTLKEKIEYFVKDIYYIIPVILTVILSFGFVVTHSSVNVDTLSANRYFEEGELIAQARFGTVLLNKIFHVMQFNPFFVDFIAVVFMVAAAITFCIALKKATNNKIKPIIYTIFSCLFISYPLINEIFVYTPASLTIGLCYFGVAVCVNFMQKYFSEKKTIYMIYTAAILTMIIASYESFASVYLCCMFSVLILDCICNNKKITFKETVINILEWIIPLLVSIIVSQMIARILMNILGIEKSLNATRGILYLSEGFTGAINYLIDGIIYSFVLKGLFYLPIAILLISVVINIIMSIIFSVKRKNITLYLLFLGTRVSLIAISILQGMASPYRACQVFAIFICFTFMLFTQTILNTSIKKALKKLLVILMFTLVFYQAKNLHKWFYLNYLRYENEKSLLITVANELQREHDISKPVFFVTEYELPEYISEKANMDTESKRYKLIENISKNMFTKKYRDINVTTKIPETNVSSYINWGFGAFEESNTEIFKWLKLLGYEFKQGDVKTLKAYLGEFLKLNRYPDKNYIVETSEFIVVRL